MTFLGLDLFSVEVTTGDEEEGAELAGGTTISTPVGFTRNECPPCEDEGSER